MNPTTISTVGNVIFVLMECERIMIEKPIIQDFDSILAAYENIIDDKTLNYSTAQQRRFQNRLHRESFDQLMQSPDFRKKVMEGIEKSPARQAYHSSEEFIAHLATLHEQTREYAKTPVGRARYSEMAKKAWSSEEHRENMRNARKEYFAKPENRAAHSARIKQLYIDRPEIALKISATLRQRHIDNPEFAKAIGAKNKAANRVAEKSSRYLGPMLGISHEKQLYIVVRGHNDYETKNVVRRTVMNALKREDKRAMSFVWMRTTEGAVLEIAGLGYREITNLDDAKDKEYIVGVHKDTGHKVQFSSMTELKSAGWHRGHVWNSIKTGCLYKGYQWAKE